MSLTGQQMLDGMRAIHVAICPFCGSSASGTIESTREKRSDPFGIRAFVACDGKHGCCGARSPSFSVDADVLHNEESLKMLQLAANWWNRRHGVSVEPSSEDTPQFDIERNKTIPCQGVAIKVDRLTVQWRGKLEIIDDRC
jgi:hypothetical protein